MILEKCILKGNPDFITGSSTQRDSLCGKKVVLISGVENNLDHVSTSMCKGSILAKCFWNEPQIFVKRQIVWPKKWYKCVGFKTTRNMSLHKAARDDFWQNAFMVEP